MNERFLFRARRTDNGEWIRGYLFKIWEQPYILWGMTNDVPNMVEVKGDTICQCTGLYDRDEDLIFEGDILAVDIGRERMYGVVKFGDYSDTQYGFYVDWPGKNYWRHDLGYWKDKCLVVATIHDHYQIDPEAAEDK